MVHLSRLGDAVKMKFKLQWRFQDVGNARDVQKLLGKAAGSPEEPCGARLP